MLFVSRDNSSNCESVVAVFITEGSFRTKFHKYMEFILYGCEDSQISLNSCVDYEKISIIYEYGNFTWRHAVLSIDRSLSLSAVHRVR